MNYFDKFVESYGESGEGLPFFLRWNFTHILRYLPEEGSPKLLDLGTGNGLLIKEIKKHNPGFDCTGIDFSEEMLKKAKENLKECEFIKAELPEIPLKDKEFDFVVSNNVIHHIKDKEKLFKEVFRVMTGNSKFIYADTHDIEDSNFDKIKEDIWEKMSLMAEKYKASAEKCWNSLPQELKDNHPEEFHVKMNELIVLLEKAGFTNVGIKVMPYYFIVAYAEKK